jgi:low affinity Fe/Cu permease
MGRLFTRFASLMSRATGSGAAFVAAAVFIVVWLLSGPLFGFTDTWQLIVNTSTTIVTFLVVFLIQNTQNRDSEAIHAKLDELIKVNKDTRNALIGIEHLTEKEIAEVLSGEESEAAVTETS